MSCIRKGAHKRAPLRGCRTLQMDFSLLALTRGWRTMPHRQWNVCRNGQDRSLRKYIIVLCLDVRHSKGDSCTDTSVFAPTWVNKQVLWSHTVPTSPSNVLPQWASGETGMRMSAPHGRANVENGFKGRSPLRFFFSSFLFYVKKK